MTDVHGNSALFEATKNNHDEVAEMLLKHGAELSMSESLAATTLCQAVYDGDILTLKRLLNAKIHVNASDYDKRTAAHIAASEGNVAALKLLVEAGADLSLEDRWGDTVRSEAANAKSGRVLAFLDSLNSASAGNVSAFGVIAKAGTEVKFARFEAGLASLDSANVAELVDLTLNG